MNLSANLTARSIHGEYRVVRVHTPLGWMVAGGDEEVLYFLEFADGEGKGEVSFDRSGVIGSVGEELCRYFEDGLKEFRTPLFFSGSAFQNQVWEELKKIPYGQTRSYSDIAKAIGKPTAFRAVAQANGANPFAILIPCHRVINKDGSLGGYSSGIERKEWLLHYEKRVQTRFSE